MSGLRKFALEQPVIFWSFVIGGVGPALVYGVPKVRREFFGYKGVPGLPLTYPMPNRPRNPPSGYEDN